MTSVFPIEAQLIEPRYKVVEMDSESIDHDAYNCIEETESDKFFTGWPDCTIDGFRRRIPELHADYPPESYTISESNDNLESL